MKIGDYVRDKDGNIDKFIGKREKRLFTSNTLTSYASTMEVNVYENDNIKNTIVKSSSNIIDLIERFDLVNGHLVICKMYENEKNIPTIVKCVGDYYFKEEDIKSIVTKEQFSSMEYRV